MSHLQRFSFKIFQLQADRPHVGRQSTSLGVFGEGRGHHSAPKLAMNSSKYSTMWTNPQVLVKVDSMTVALGAGNIYDINIVSTSLHLTQIQWTF